MSSGGDPQEPKPSTSTANVEVCSRKKSRPSSLEGDKLGQSSGHNSRSSKSGKSKKRHRKVTSREQHRSSVASCDSVSSLPPSPADLVNEIQKHVHENSLLTKFENVKDRSRYTSFTSPILVQKQHEDVMQRLKIDVEKYYDSGIINTVIGSTGHAEATKPFNRMNLFTGLLQNANIAQLEDTLNPKKITEQIAGIPEEDMEHIPNDKDINLLTLEYQSNCLKARESDNNFAKVVTLGHRMLKTGGFISDVTRPDTSGCTEVTVPIPNTVIKMCYYQPHWCEENRHLKQPTELAEYLILGSQTLAELKEVLFCEVDTGKQCRMINKGEKCSMKNLFDNASTCKELFPSSYFYINGVLYDDLRDNKRVKLSEAVMKYLRENFDHGEITAPISAGRMESTKFNEIIMDLGMPYVYIHQGDCEHVIVFTEVRNLTASDCLQLEKYPLVSKVMVRKVLIGKCYICNDKAAQKLVLVTCDTIPGSAGMESSRSRLYCTTCLQVAFFDKDAKATTDFTIQEWVSPNAAIADVEKLLQQ